ncbi:trans-sulfuration enzyme family protein [Flavihumibacter sp. UBA7668]|uniref:trans-sulfuration enzyme family protein n=1 Tax=Flavihumibacter sp. UBA7668 TaxID=1946542 RepID=UPI0025BF97B8|nr:PLP-dependent aspartate aminotransferase family protein [Flavihumibacter sp. UBA7668]
MQATTQLLHSIPVDAQTGAIAVPIYQTSTFVQEAPGVNKGFDYSRTNNPTRQELEKIIAQLEKGTVAAAFSSGLAAIDAVIKLLESGDEILAVNDIYGGAFRLFEKVYKKFGITVTYVDMSDLTAVHRAISLKTKLIWLETPTNPTLKVADIRAIADIAERYKLLFAVDNTFASPVYQQPLTLGADIVVHSATKFIGGHSDVIAGLIIAKDPEIGKQIKFYQNACGAVLGPFDSFLLIRGLETLHLRVQQHTRSATQVAQFLQKHAAVEEVFYPGFGGVVSFRLKQDSESAASIFVQSTQLFHLAESLGGVKSLISHPVSMTHKSIDPEKRKAAGITDGLIRLSVGLEDAADLVNDLEDAFQQITQNKKASGLLKKEAGLVSI